MRWLIYDAIYKLDHCRLPLIVFPQYFSGFTHSGTFIRVRRCVQRKIRYRRTFTPHKFYKQYRSAHLQNDL